MVDKTLVVKIDAAVGSFSLNLSFTAPVGLTVLFGPSGSGKSTLLDCLAGLRTPDNGEIAVGDRIFYDSAKRLNLPPQKRKVGYVFQNPTLFPHLSVRENIGFGLQSWQPERQKARLEELLELFSLESLSDRHPASLSGGESQRTAIARALAPAPQLLLLDEPFSALDSQLRTSLSTQLRSLQRQLSLPMVLVTHSSTDARQLADLVVHIQAGQMQTIGLPDLILPPRTHP